MDPKTLVASRVPLQEPLTSGGGGGAKRSVQATTASTASMLLPNVGDIMASVSGQMPAQTAALQQAFVLQMPQQPLQMTARASEPLPVETSSLQTVVRLPQAPIGLDSRRCFEAISPFLKQQATKFTLALSEQDPKAAAEVLGLVGQTLALPPEAHAFAPEAEAALRALSECELYVGAHFRGTAHHASKGNPASSPWKDSLRHDGSFSLSHATVVEHYAAQILDPAKRAEALKATVVLLSWIAPAWHEADALEYAMHLECQHAALDALLQILHKVSLSLRSGLDRTGFSKEIEFAFGPLCCSPLLAEALRSREEIPSWIRAPLFAALDAVALGGGGELFPYQGRIEEKYFVDVLRIADQRKLPSGVLRCAVMVVVRGTAKRFRSLLSGGEFKMAREELENLAQAIVLPRVKTDLSDTARHALQAIGACDAAVQPFLSGSLHYHHSHLPSSGRWRQGLRHGEKSQYGLSSTVVLPGKAALHNPAQRAAAFNNMIVLLSWLVAPWDQGGRKAQEKHSDFVKSTLSALFNALTSAYSALTDDVEKSIFSREMLTAIVPACCSPLLAELQLGREDIPAWLNAPLRSALVLIKDGKGDELFPRHRYFGPRKRISESASVGTGGTKRPRELEGPPLEPKRSRNVLSPPQPWQMGPTWDVRQNRVAAQQQRLQQQSAHLYYAQQQLMQIQMQPLMQLPQSLPPMATPIRFTVPAGRPPQALHAPPRVPQQTKLNAALGGMGQGSAFVPLVSLIPLSSPPPARTPVVPEAVPWTTTTTTTTATTTTTSVTPAARTYADYDTEIETDSETDSETDT